MDSVNGRSELHAHPCGRFAPLRGRFAPTWERSAPCGERSAPWDGRSAPGVWRSAHPGRPFVPGDEPFVPRGGPSTNWGGRSSEQGGPSMRWGNHPPPGDEPSTRRGESSARRCLRLENRAAINPGIDRRQVSLILCATLRGLQRAWADGSFFDKRCTRQERDSGRPSVRRSVPFPVTGVPTRWPTPRGLLAEPGGGCAPAPERSARPSGSGGGPGR